MLTKNIRTLILYEPIAASLMLYPPGLVERLQAYLEDGDRESLLTTFMREVVNVPPEELEILRSAPAWQGRIKAAHTIVREIQAAYEQKFDPERYEDLTTPTLLLLGSESPDVFRTSMAMVKSALPNSQIAVLPGQRHAAMDTGPEIFTREVIRFVRTDRLPDVIAMAGVTETEA